MPSLIFLRKWKMQEVRGFSPAMPSGVCLRRANIFDVNRGWGIRHFLFGFDQEMPRRRTYFNMTLNRQYRGAGVDLGAYTWEEIIQHLQTQKRNSLPSRRFGNASLRGKRNLIKWRFESFNHVCFPDPNRAALSHKFIQKVCFQRI